MFFSAIGQPPSLVVVGMSARANGWAMSGDCGGCLKRDRGRRLISGFFARFSFVGNKLDGGLRCFIMLRPAVHLDIPIVVRFRVTVHCWCRQFEHNA